MKKYLLFSIIAVLFGCEQAVELQEDDMTVCNEKVASSLTITSEQACKEALGFFEDEHGTVSRSSAKKISSVYAWRYDEIFPFDGTRVRTRSSQLTDTLMYIVNFEEGGFALIAADKRIPSPLLAVIDDGNFSPDDDIDNDGFRYFLDEIPEYYEYEISNYSDTNSDEVFPPIQGPWTVLKNYPILLKTAWGQNEPFNDLCYTSDGEKAKAGCVAIAVGQLLAYHKKPNSYNGHTYNWNQILTGKEVPTTSEGKKSVAYLISDVGEIVDMTYGVSASGAYTIRVKDCLELFGYNYSYSTSYVSERCFSNFTSQRPVYIRADNGSEAHAWVLDGAIIRSREVKQYNWEGVLILDETEQQKLIHCNWGGYGQQNGYFKVAVFDPKLPPVEINNIQTRAAYNKNYMMYYDVYPQE